MFVREISEGGPAVRIFSLAETPSVFLTKVCACILMTHPLLLCPINCLAEFLLIWNISCQWAGIRLFVCIFQDEQMQTSELLALL